MDVQTPTEGPLAQPTRARIFAALADLRRPASTLELAELLQLHRNGVRLHLEHLERTGMILRSRERQARGRPSDQWSINPSALPGGDPPTAYADLGRWLVRTMTSSKVGLREIEASGRKIGADLASEDERLGPEERMHAALTALGFQPEREVGEDGRMTYCLRNCPYRDVVRERQAIVCTMHRGITRGLLDALDPETKLTNFVIEDPDAAACRIELRGDMAREASANTP